MVLRSDRRCFLRIDSTKCSLFHQLGVRGRSTRHPEGVGSERRVRLPGLDRQALGGGRNRATGESCINIHLCFVFTALITLVKYIHIDISLSLIPNSIFYPFFKAGLDCDSGEACIPASLGIYDNYRSLGYNHIPINFIDGIN